MRESSLDYEATTARSFRRDALNNPVANMRPEELLFIHRALVSARQELELAEACFDAEERRQAAQIASKLVTQPLAAASAITSTAKTSLNCASAAPSPDSIGAVAAF